MSNIKVENLTKKFEAATAVDGISFSVGPGEVFGFLGPNGAGKSTTINILCTLLSATSGRAEVAGFDCASSPDEVRQAIGIIFQDPTLDNGLTAYENLLFHAYLYDLDRVTARRRIAEVLALVDLTARKDDLVRKFSGGMKRRLEIARGLLHYPKVLFMDEPTLGLDPQSRNMIWEFIRTLKADTGITIFMTTHYLEEAESCDRVAIIDLGKVIAIGSPAELKAGLRGDTIRLVAKDNDALAAEVRERFGMDAKVSEGAVTLTVERGEEFLPALIKTIRAEITSVNLTKPSLNDVFLALTGKSIRDEEADPNNVMRAMARSSKKRGH
ncbi:MAG: ATP-binding cassette domain-containing protein [Nitrospirae bacterium]|nr:ATP-binding cassette domain-containing protein [Nitrospirota bacterium]